MPSAPIKLTVLGSGTSMGVPTLTCHCPVCTSPDPLDNRLRPSILLSRNGQNVVIDTTPDFRQQALRARLERLDAVLLTHSHADHILGFDDIRPFNIRQRAALPVYSNEETFQVIRRAFAYVFDEAPSLSSVPSVTLHQATQPFELLGGVSFIPIPLAHGPMQVLGFRFGRAAYLTDFSSVPDSSLALLTGLDDLILDALRDTPHPMHQTVDQALALIARLQPRRAWFTHIAHDLPHAETNERLRKMGLTNVQLAYDGLQFDVQVDAPAQTAHSATCSSPELATFNSTAAWNAKYFATGCGSVLAIGNFDGIHIGHQSILRAVAARAHSLGAVATALTFDPSPRKILRPESAPLRLSTNAQRLEWFKEVGLEAAVVMPFTLELARLAPEEFVEQCLVRDLRVRALLVGENFRFGHQQAGNVHLLQKLGAKHNFEVVIIPPVSSRGEVVSSTSIRREVSAGNVTRAARLMGRPFALTGKVVTGTGTGRRFTFPTLNLVPDQELLPARGVYITRTLFDGHSTPNNSVTNIGIRPTFNGSSLSVETHLLEFPHQATPQRIEVQFCKRLREEKKFTAPEELRTQIARDIATATTFFRRLDRFRSPRAPA